MERVLADHGIDFTAEDHPDQVACDRGGDVIPLERRSSGFSHPDETPPPPPPPAPPSRHLGATSAISLANVVLAAQDAVSPAANGGNLEADRRPWAPKPQEAISAMRDSIFGLHTKPVYQQASFPDRDVATRLVGLYFGHANPQVPILHRGQFMKMFEATWAEDASARHRTDRELYFLFMVFAIGSGIYLGDSRRFNDRHGCGEEKQAQPEAYHATAMLHLEKCLSASGDRADPLGGGLEELQAVLLLAGFALLRPISPGLWYIAGVAVRLAVDLGLHFEGNDGDVRLGEQGKMTEREVRERAGRREWQRDFKRRLWWCTYSFDRLVSTCVGRPFGITDLVITTEFPSLLDDDYITPEGILPAPPGQPSYKHAAYHYFRLRLLQSEILQVLQHQQAQVASRGEGRGNPWILTNLSSPFLLKFQGDFHAWCRDMDARLEGWRQDAPTSRQLGVPFNPMFLELNYWQCIISLYRPSLRAPAPLRGEFHTGFEAQGSRLHALESTEEGERVFLRVAEAAQQVLRLYRKLHVRHLVNYTFLSTHHIFMSGIAFLYSIWHSPAVRKRLVSMMIPVRVQH